MSFFQTVKDSIWNPAFYRAKANDPRGAFGYYFKLALLISVVMTAGFAIFVGPNLSATLRALPDGLVAYYPDDLEITLDNGSIRSNKTGPYPLPYPESLKMTGTEASEQTTNLIVIDTDATFTLQSFNAADTMVLVTQDAVAYLDGHEMRVFSATEFACKDDKPCSYTLTNDKLAGYMQMVKPYTNNVLPFMAVGVLLFFLVAFTVGLIALLIVALVTMLVLRVSKVSATKLSYGTVYRLCLHGITLALLVDLGLQALQLISGGMIPHINGFWFQLVLTVLVVTLNLKSANMPTPVANTTPLTGSQN